ncbi:MAG: hypothetical protein U1E39_13230 [Planctomycetota bacterium]
MNDTLFGVLIGAIAGAVPALMNLLDAHFRRKDRAAERARREQREAEDRWRRRARVAFRAYVNLRYAGDVPSARIRNLGALRPFVGSSARQVIDGLRIEYAKLPNGTLGNKDERVLDDAVLADIGTTTEAPGAP